MESPPEVLDLLERLVRNAHARPLTPATLVDRLARALREAGFLNEAGEALHRRTPPNESNAPSP